MKGYSQHLVPSSAGPLVGHVQDAGGPVVVLQHGLCGDANQPADVFPSGHDFAHAILDCRGHGASPLGAPEDLSIATFAQDVAAMAELLSPIALGGISMGAAIALRLSVLRPDLVPALILLRPAWVTDAAPANMAPNAEVGAMLDQGVVAFDATQTARHLALHAPDNLASLRGFFGRQPLQATGELLTRISADGPGVSESDLSALRLPVLVLGCEQDFVHPMDHARRLAHLIPGAELVELPPKGQDRAAHAAAARLAILQFLKGLPHAAPAP